LGFGVWGLGFGVVAGHDGMAERVRQSVNRDIHGETSMETARERWRHGPVDQIIAMVKWIRSSRLPIKNSLSLSGGTGATLRSTFIAATTVCGVQGGGETQGDR